MARYAVKVEYNGKYFHGFQKQLGIPTVQGVFEGALVSLLGLEIKTIGSGRTDTGVHSFGQVLAFDLPHEVEVRKTMKSINALVPDKLAITAIKMVADDFNPRRDAVWREYRYFIHRREAPSPLLAEFSYHYSRPLDVEMMKKACELFLGEHDFTAFRIKSGDESNVRNILKCELLEMPLDVLCLVTRANAFLYRMVRLMGGAILDAGTKKKSLKEIENHLNSGTEPCCEALPAEGLFLWEVAYPPELLQF